MPMWSMGFAQTQQMKQAGTPDSGSSLVLVLGVECSNSHMPGKGAEKGLDSVVRQSVVPERRQAKVPQGMSQHKRCMTQGGAPGLGSSLVLVVDGVEVVILHMPGKGCPNHANIEHGRGHAWNRYLQELQS